VWVLANVIGFGLMGGMEAIEGYRASMAVFERPDELNYPDFRVPTSMQRLDWPYLLNAISPDLYRSKIIAMFLTALSAVWLILQFYRARSFANELDITAAFLGPLVCLSLLCVYHHHYDVIPLLGPVIIYLGRRVEPRDWLPIFFFVAPAILFAGLFPVDRSQRLVEAVFGEGSSAGLKLVGTVCMNIAYVASLVLLHRCINRRTAQAAAAAT
jgi:hypothetical protein